VKIVFDKTSQRVIGGQIVSNSESAVKEIDAINALILGYKTISDLTTLMCAGNPDCSSEPSLEPITIAAEQALQKLRQTRPPALPFLIYAVEQRVDPCSRGEQSE